MPRQSRRELWELNFMERVKHEMRNQDIQYKVTWFRKKIKDSLQIPTKYKILTMEDRRRKTIAFGKMYFFIYEAKHAKTLPFWDRFPLVIPFAQKSGENNTPGFLGMNLHYLPPKLRFELLAQLIEYSTSKRFSPSTRLQLTYGLLKASSAHRLIKPCIHHYLLPHVANKYTEIKADEWHIAATLPLEEFQKKNKTFVWNDSKRKAGL